MINVSPAIVNEYLTDSVNKNLTVYHEGTDLDEINYYTGDLSPDNKARVRSTLSAGQNAVTLVADASDWSFDYFPYMHAPIIDDWDGFFVRVSFGVVNLTSSASLLSSPVITVRLYDDSNNPTHYYYFQRTYNYEAYERGIYYMRIDRSRISDYFDNVWKIELIIRVLDNNAQAGDEMIWETLAPAFYFSRKHMDAPIWTPAPDFDNVDLKDFGYTLNNNELVYEEFSLTESLCSKDNLKLGLCESAHCEFKCVSSDPITNGNKIEVFSSLNGFSINNEELFAINWSGIDTSGQSGGTNNHDLCYKTEILTFGSDTDWSKYIDELALKNKVVKWTYSLEYVLTNITGTTPVYFRQIVKCNYGGVLYDFELPEYYLLSDYATFNEMSGEMDLYESVNFGQMCGVYCFAIRVYDGNKNPYSVGDCQATETVYATQLQVRLCDKNSDIPFPAYSVRDLYYANGTLDLYLDDKTGRIPLGVFNISSVEREYKHNLVTKHIEAYDKLVTLENNAADWYTRYMFGVDTDDWNSNGFEFARQIYGSFFDYAVSVDLDSRDNYTETQIAYYEYFADIKPSRFSDKYLSWRSGAIKLRYAEFNIISPDPSKLYMVEVNNVTNNYGERYSDDYILTNYIGDSYAEQVDPLKRGVVTNGGVLIMETRDDGTTAGFCLNRSEYFMISSNCTSFKVYVPVVTVDSDNTIINRIIDDVAIYEVSSAPELTNGNLRLCYYNYGTKNIFACESSITGRDVVRSLLEVCGCFFRLDRFNGRPEFVYPTKGGLYPSNTLYPADDLYPRTGTDELFSMGKYISVRAENYEVKDFGRIQILKNTKSNDTVSVCEWQYEGDPDAENTYIIDDNIFYCADDMMYDYGNMPEVADMLEGMWGVISNLGYVPNITQALGAPWLECGDRIGLLTYDGGFESFVFRRTLKGIQNLRDTYESVGDEKNDAINNFGY